MNLQLDTRIEETIVECMAAYNVPDDVIDKVVENIHYCFKETNYLHNSVNDSNYSAAQEAKENRQITSLKADIEKTIAMYEKEMESLKYDLQRANWKIEELKEQRWT